MRSLQLNSSDAAVSDEFEALRGCVLSVGNFDGVHLGHRAIIDAMKHLAGQSPIVAVTFEPHPTEVLRPVMAPKRLTPWSEKLRQLEAAGVDATYQLTHTN